MNQGWNLELNSDSLEKEIIQIQFEYLWLRPSLLSWSTLVCKYTMFRAVAFTDTITPSFSSHFKFIIKMDILCIFNTLILFVCTECVQQRVYSVQCTRYLYSGWSIIGLTREQFLLRHWAATLGLFYYHSQLQLYFTHRRPGYNQCEKLFHKLEIIYISII